VRYGNPLTGQVRYRYYPVPGTPSNPNWAVNIPGSLLGPDSVNVMPAKRKPNKTFFEIYTESGSPAQHRIYAHAEGDTVHMNSWVLVYGGGFDADSKYALRITIGNPNLPGIGTTPVLTSTGPNGSPVGQHFRIPVLLDSIGPLRAPGTGIISTFPESQIYPFSDPSFVAEPHIGAYQGMQQSGKAYTLLRSEDGDRGKDDRIVDPVAFRDSIDQGLITPGMPRYALKDKVLVFYVNRAPYLLQDDPSFQPKPGQVFATRRITLTLDKTADDDPYQTTQRKVGGFDSGNPSLLLLRFSVTFRGIRTGSNPPRDTVWAPPELARKTQTNLQWNLDVPGFIQGPNVAVEIEVCDCKDCEAVPGQGRCRRYPPINVTIPALTAEQAAQSRAIPSTGPGSSGEMSRSRTP